MDDKGARSWMERAWRGCDERVCLGLYYTSKMGRFWGVGLQVGLQTGVTFLKKWGYRTGGIGVRKAERG